MPTWRRITSRRAGARPHDSHACVSPNVKPPWLCASCCSNGTPPSEENEYELTIGARRSFLERVSEPPLAVLGRNPLQLALAGRSAHIPTTGLTLRAASPPRGVGVVSSV